MKIGDIFDLDLLLDMANKGMVRIQFHPLFPLCIATYTKDAVVNREWNPVTMACRGLIWNEITHEVVARPFPKFFNLGKPGARQDYDAEVEVTDKMDGSLGIGYVWEGKCYIATKGSFNSPQADEGNRLLHTYYPDWLPPTGITPLWEIVYPENRIVLDYGDLRYLSLIAGIDISSGRDDNYAIWGSKGWNGASVNLTSYKTLQEAVSSLPRPNAEGWVVRYLDTDERVKIKQKDYLAKHKLVFNLSQKTIWESLRDCRFSEYKAGMPDEFHEWMDTEAEKYWKKYDDYMSVVYDNIHDQDLDYLIHCALGGERYARLMIAELISEFPSWLEGTIWCIVDGYSYHRIIFKQFEPKGQTKVAKP